MRRCASHKALFILFQASRLRSTGEAAMNKTDLSDVYRDYIACLNKQDWPKLEQFVYDEVCYNGQRIGILGYREMLERDFYEFRTFISTFNC
jgi:predicted ester cyclase